MKRLLITLMVLFSVLLTSCGEPNNSASTNDSENASQESSTELSKESIDFDATATGAQMLVEEWLKQNPLYDSMPDIETSHLYELNGKPFYLVYAYIDGQQLTPSFLVDMNGNIFTEVQNETVSIDEWYETVGSSYGAVTEEEAKAIADKFIDEYITEWGNVWTESYYEEDDNFYLFTLIFQGDIYPDILAVNKLTGELFGMNPKSKSTMAALQWFEFFKDGERPWIDFDDESSADAISYTITATDLLGQWIWDSNNGLDKAFGEQGLSDGNTLKQITFLSNGTCNGGVALRYASDELGAMFEGVSDSDIFRPQYWEFLEYEQILQLSGVKNDSVWTGSTWKNVTNNITASFSASMIGGVLYLENINDSSTAIIQYNKNQ